MIVEMDILEPVTPLASTTSSTASPDLLLRPNSLPSQGFGW